LVTTKNVSVSGFQVIPEALAIPASSRGPSVRS